MTEKEREIYQTVMGMRGVAEKKLYQVKLIGCDMTEFIIQLSDEERVLVNKICEISKRFGGGCRPTMEIERYDEFDEGEAIRA